VTLGKILTSSYGSSSPGNGTLKLSSWATTLTVSSAGGSSGRGGDAASTLLPRSQPLDANASAAAQAAIKPLARRGVSRLRL
jgi:hypothetical protein